MLHIDRLALHALGLAAALTLLPPPATAQSTDSARIADLERRIEAVTRELERMQLGQETVIADAPTHGFGQAASKVYGVQQGVSLGGYGEFLYENFSREREDGSRSSGLDRIDAVRVIVYVGYKFSDRLIFNSEIEVEHGKEIFLEFAYLDYMLGEQVGVRAGMLLAPMGLVNELHEPPSFLGSARPVTETRIIPTTWRENGIGLFGNGHTFSWRVYLMNSFDGSNFTGSGLRGGRQKGSQALAEDFSLVGRLDYTGTPGLLVGGSMYSGETAQGKELNGVAVGGRTNIWDFHFDFKRRGWDVRGVFARAAVDQAAALNALNGLSGSDGIGTSMSGWYAQVGYDVLLGKNSAHQLVPYLRYERVNTQRKVANGFSVDPANDLTVTSVGAAWKPVSQVVAKLDYQIHANGAARGVDQWNVSIGWLF
jgi:hypothetical protein